MTSLMDWEQLTHEEILRYDTNRYDFREIVQKMFCCNNLEQLHTLFPEYTKPNAISFENDQQTEMHKIFYDSPLLGEFKGLYQKFIREVIAPMFLDPVVVYQAMPTFRVHPPNNVAVGNKHRDGDYNHPEGEINFWVPLTKVWGNNGFWVETSPGKGDFHPVGPLEYGEMFRFYGNRCEHYNNPNDTGSTRVSFDFRVMPYSKYTPKQATSVKAKKKFEIGSYYDVMGNIGK